MNLKHHTTDLTCEACAFLKLRKSIARTQKEREQWQKLIDEHLDLAHKREEYQPALPVEG